MLDAEFGHRLSVCAIVVVDAERDARVPIALITRAAVQAGLASHFIVIRVDERSSYAIDGGESSEGCGSEFTEFVAPELAIRLMMIDPEATGAALNNLQGVDIPRCGNFGAEAYPKHLLQRIAVEAK